MNRRIGVEKMEEKHVVIIYPHPDDESFGAAGSIIQFREQGAKVTYLCGTLGEMGRNMGSPAFANRETLPQIRKQELVDACEYLDIDFQLLGYRDKTIEYEDKQEVAEHLKEIIEELAPTLVIGHYPGYAIHPDHDALGAATIEAVQMMEPEARPTVWAQAISANYEEVLGEPDVVHDISHIFDRKAEAIFKHKSQASGMIERFNNPDQVDAAKEEWKQRLGKEKFYIWNFDK